MTLCSPVDQMRYARGRTPDAAIKNLGQPGNGSKERRAGVGQRRTDGIAVFAVSGGAVIIGPLSPSRIFRLNSLAAAPVSRSAVDDEFRTGDEARFVGREE